MPLTPPSDLNPRTDPPLDFADKEFGGLTHGDYDVLGFLGGLEVHQQLDTKSKLFCRCPAGRYTDRYDAEVLRHMRPTLSELGEYDGTALMEFKTKKEIIYRLNRRIVCTYEIDDTPPFEIDTEAVEIAIEQSRLLNLNLVSELHVMRKQYLDGSIPTGFQRTAVIGMGGAIPFREPALGIDRELTIRQLSLEEDSCREVSDVGHRIVFNTDRLGIPLSEAVTEPELLTPLEMQAAGRLLARVANAMRKVRRGAGAGRQDVNVSIAGGRRVEIKGVPHHLGLPRLVHVEAFRQLNLLRIRATLHDRGVTHDMLAVPDEGLPWDVSNLVADVTHENAVHGIRVAVQVMQPDDVIAAVRLPGFGGLLQYRTQPGLDFSHEISERVRVIACPVTRPFMVHSDQDGADSVVRWKDIRESVGADAGDAVVVLWMPQQDAATAAREVLARAQDALVGVPAETRQVHRDGTNGFERILPGADRMYPDTDTPPLPIADDVVKRISANLPELPWDREQRYEVLGLSAGEARWVVDAPWGDVFDALLGSATGIERRLAYAIGLRVPFHMREVAQPQSSIVNHDVRTTVNRLLPFVEAVRDGLVRVEALPRMIDLALTSAESSDEIIARHAPSDAETLDQVIEDVATEARTMSGRSGATLERWAMGAAMARLLGRADPAEVRAALGAALAPATEVRS